MLSLFLWYRNVNFMEKELCTRFWDVLKLWRYEDWNSVSVTSYPWMYRIFHLWFSLHSFVRLMEENSPIKFYGVLLHFSGTYEVAKFWMVKLYPHGIDVIHANKHTKSANSGLPVNFWIFLLKSFCFMMKKYHFKQKLLLWSYFSFKMLLLHRCFSNANLESGFSITGTLAATGLKIFPLTKIVALHL